MYWQGYKKIKCRCSNLRQYACSCLQKLRTSRKKFRLNSRTQVRDLNATLCNRGRVMTSQPASSIYIKKQCSIQACLNFLEVLHQEAMSSTVYQKYSKYLIVVIHSHYWKCEVKTLKEFATRKRKYKRKNKCCCTVTTAF